MLSIFRKLSIDVNKKKIKNKFFVKIFKFGITPVLGQIGLRQVGDTGRGNLGLGDTGG